MKDITAVGAVLLGLLAEILPCTWLVVTVIVVICLVVSGLTVVECVVLSLLPELTPNSSSGSSGSSSGARMVLCAAVPEIGRAHV